MDRTIIENDILYFDNSESFKEALAKIVFKYLSKDCQFYTSCDFGIYQIQISNITNVKEYIKDIVKNGYDKNSDMLKLIYSKLKNGVELDSIVTETFEELLTETLNDN